MKIGQRVENCKGEGGGVHNGGTVRGIGRKFKEVQAHVVIAVHGKEKFSFL